MSFVLILISNFVVPSWVLQMFAITILFYLLDRSVKQKSVWMHLKTHTGMHIFVKCLSNLVETN